MNYTKMTKKAILIILDGWGIGKKDKADAIYNANTPYWDSLIQNYLHSEIKTYGEYVGLPDGQMGNSEVGHLNIGAGRVIFQDLVKINNAVEDGSLAKNETLLEAYNYAKNNNKKVHLIGLVSNGGVHSDMQHLFALADIAKANDIDNLYVHALTDGRDVDPYSGKGFIGDLEEQLKKSTGKIASICGRYYSMDRDKRWERVKIGYDLLTTGKGEKFDSPTEAMQASYDNEITDEFIKPIILDENGLIEKDDVVICFNFRTDRLRELTTVLTQVDMPEHEMKTIPLYYITMTQYDSSFKNVKLMFSKDNIKKTLGELVQDAGGSQLRIAETEKYPHVTFFFSGGREEAFKNEERVLINSPKVATYDMQPEMSAFLVADAVVEELNKKKFDFVCLNYANCDMVGHTGSYESILQAVEAVDTSLGRTIEAAKNNDYDAIIIADHGNADMVLNADGSINTAHTVGSVPIVYVGEQYKNIKPGILADIAPTLCKIMGLDIPKEMTGKVLID